MNHLRPAAFVNETEVVGKGGEHFLFSQISKFSSVNSAAEDIINCDLCSKTFDSRHKLHWHCGNNHNNKTSKSEQRNSTECPLKSYYLAVKKKHVDEKVGTTKQKLCIYCNVLFFHTKTLNIHLQEVLSLLPVTNFGTQTTLNVCFWWYSAIVFLRNKLWSFFPTVLGRTRKS